MGRGELGAEREAEKKAAAAYAVDRFVEGGMKLGLGTGTTAIWSVRRLAELIAAGGLEGIRAVSTSRATGRECERLGIPLFGLDSPEVDGRLDLAIDGADEVDPDLRLLKGGGGAHLMEKLVEYNSDRLVIAVDETKLVEHLGLAFPLPIELVPEALASVSRELKKYNGRLSLRNGADGGRPMVTEHGNLILDLLFPSPVDPSRLESELKLIPGVVELGFFAKKRPTLVIGRAEGRIEVVE
jgi:ribose 5-phosphate isomerase A